MNITLDMPLVSECGIVECAYNVDQACHARAITIGDGVHPGCDTFFSAAGHSKESHRIAGVGACKVTACQHNDDYECVAENIHVGFEGGSINCLTYATQ